MKLVTFQSIDALKFLINNGYLECNRKYINLEKVGRPYNWVVEKMNKCIKNESDSEYPIWAWVRCYNNIYPKKHKGKPIDGFDVKITFNKDEKEVFVTDFRKYSFVLNNTYIPDSLEDKNKFFKQLEEFNITNDDLKAYTRLDKYKSYRTDKEYLDICKRIEKSFDKCITNDSDILQGCVWRINLEEVESIEMLKKDGYTYGTLNYVRSNGKRFDWINDYYKKLN